VANCGPIAQFGQTNTIPTPASWSDALEATSEQSVALKRGCPMDSPLRSLIASGTKLWLDSIDPDLVVSNRALGATGATSNPIIVSGLIETGRFDQDLDRLVHEGLSDEAIAWQLTDRLVRGAQQVFLPVWQQTRGNDGYVSFELDPLLEDVKQNMPHAQRVARYIELGKKWSGRH
jgi:transaldolase